MKTIDKITMIHLLVRDMDKAKSFYTDKSGFKATKDYEYGGNRWIVVVPP
jgi:catechol 2,3-dioxygenase-like lactoylglutathione lyase family enzyme